MRELIDLYAEISGITPQVEIRPELLRPVENPVVTGSYEKLAAHAGWKPEITLIHSLRDIYAYWLDTFKKKQLKHRGHRDIFRVLKTKALLMHYYYGTWGTVEIVFI